MEFVCFWLIGPMGAFGGPAGHEYRRTGQIPSRSGVLGLVGAALGIRRDDKSGQAALRALGTSVALYSVGIGFRDFHTIQAVPSSRIKSPKSRAQALAALKPEDNAVITRRDYVTDCAYGVALWRQGKDAPLLDDIQTALKAPAFVPYLGRKSCPVSHPLAPVMVTAANSVEVFDHVAPPSVPNLPQRPLRVTTDEAGQGDRVDWLMDDPVDRELWHFARRAAHTTYITGEGS